MIGRIILAWWVGLVALASIANPYIAIGQLTEENYAAAALFAGFSIVSWLVAKATWGDLKRRHRSQKSPSE